MDENEHKRQCELEYYHQKCMYELENYRQQCNYELEQHRQECNYILESRRTAVQIGFRALNYAFLLNGAACVALITFIGTMINTSASLAKYINMIGEQSLLWYGLGVFVAAGIQYLTFYLKYLFKEKWIGITGDWLTIISVNASYVLFGYASYRLYLFLSFHESIRELIS